MLRLLWRSNRKVVTLLSKLQKKHTHTHTKIKFLSSVLMYNFYFDCLYVLLVSPASCTVFMFITAMTVISHVPSRSLLMSCYRCVSEEGWERNQPQLHFFMPFCVFFLWPLLVLVTSDFTNIQNNLMWMGKMQYYTNSNLVMFL